MVMVKIVFRNGVTSRYIEIEKKNKNFRSTRLPALYGLRDFEVHKRFMRHVTRYAVTVR